MIVFHLLGLPPQTPRLSPPRLARLGVSILCLWLLIPLATHAYGIGTPVATDSRVKTFVYNENDVYRLLTHYGYQMNVEFGQEEEIETISVGDRTGWQIIPAGNRLFVRAMEDKAHTNMTVVTNRHAYQFDLYSAPPGAQGWDELVYVVRFYFPEDQEMMQGMAAPAGGMGYGGSYPMTPVSAPAYGGGYGGGYSQAPMMQQPMQQPMMQQPPMMMPPQASATPASYNAMAPAAGNPMMNAAPQVAGQNYNYSFTGEQSILPTQMYDDGRNTYLVFNPGQMIPQLYRVGQDGREQPVPVNANGQYATVAGTYGRLVLRFGSAHACIYNDAMGQ